MLLMKYRWYQFIGIIIATFHTFTFGLFYTPPVGYVLNPLAKIPNYPCACKSGKKIKHCHGSLKWITEKDAEPLKKFVKDVLRYEKEMEK